jgi:hypothetical protein
VIASFSFNTGEMLGGHVRAVFTLITFIFTVCVVCTVTSFSEIPLDRQEQVGASGDLHAVTGRPTGLSN